MQGSQCLGKGKRGLSGGDRPLAGQTPKEGLCDAEQVQEAQASRHCSHTPPRTAWLDSLQEVSHGLCSSLVYI